MTGAPVLSVVTPSFNQKDYIEENLRSIMSQSDVFPLEHIVIDGGSDDGTVEILSQYEDSYNLRWFSESDRGQTHALNKGVRKANGDWIGWQNSDDYYLQGAFQSLNRIVSNSTTIDLVYGDLEVVDEDGNISHIRPHARPSKLIEKYLGHFTANQCTFISSSLAEHIFPLREEFDMAMDVEYFWKILDYHPDFVHTKSTLGAFRVHDDTKSSMNRTGQIEQGKEITAEYYEEGILEKFLPDSAIPPLVFLMKVGYLSRDRRFDAVRTTLSNTGGRLLASDR